MTAETTEVDLKQPVKNSKTAQNVLAMYRDAIEKALPKHLGIEHFMRVALMSVVKNPALRECTQISLLGAVLESAQLGLLLDGVLGHAYLVPYKGAATFQVGWRGLTSLAVRSGHVDQVFHHCVYEGDDFEIEYGMHPTLSHKPDIKGSREDTNIIGAYAVAVLTSGFRDVEYMTREQIEKIRAGSRGKNSFGWTDHFAEMARKCPTRRICKRLPMSPQAQRAAVLDEMADAGQPQQLEANVPGVLDLGDAVVTEPTTGWKGHSAEMTKKRQKPQRKSASEPEKNNGS